MNCRTAVRPARAGMLEAPMIGQRERGDKSGMQRACSAMLRKKENNERGFACWTATTGSWGSCD
jgi:hypothetical protein